MKKVFYMREGRKVYYFCTFTEKHARELVAMKARVGKFCFIENAEGEQ